jgi:prepilin-type N-terminal cleavage/methylation domain-containing protein
MGKLLTKYRTAALRGFTLIELLIVIAILGILAAATLAILDPIDKINAGNDSKVQSDITNMAKAAEAFAASNNGIYPIALQDMVTSGDMRSMPTAPGGYTPYAWVGGGANPFIISGQLKSKKYVGASTPVFKYTSASGKTCAADVAANACP